jgi:ribonuclease G
MQNEIIINAELGEIRVALLEKSQFAELHIERQRDKSVAGNVLKGRVSRVLPGMQAAFVDIGLEKAAFLYVGDYFESKLETGESEGEPVGGRRRNGRGGGGRSAPPRIDTVLHEGKEIVVQIAKEPIGSKGARITSSLSIPGRHLVLTPWSRRVGVSRRIASDRERRRLREIVERLRPKNLGFIIRTAGDGVREADLQADIRYLATVWAAIQKRHAEQQAPAILYSEHDLPLRIVRDIASHETKRIVTDDKQVFDSIENFVERFVADPKPKVEHHQDWHPIFERFDLEGQIDANLERKVWLKSGGSLVMDKSEALTAIDVNTGRFVGKRDLEETVLKTNLEAVAEVVHQLRFRNLGGLIIIDLIDMESAANRDKVYRALQDALRADKARTNILKISELGLVEMTRKRTRENLVQTLCEPCAYCEGRSYVLSPESVAFRVLREIRKHLPRFRGRAVAVAVNPQVAEELLTHAKPALAKLGDEIGTPIEIRARPGLHQERFELSVLESGPPVEIDLPWLRDRHPDASKTKDTKDTKDAKDAKDAKDSNDADDKKRRRRRGGRGRSRRSESPSPESEPAEAVESPERGAAAPRAKDAETAETPRAEDAETAETPEKLQAKTQDALREDEAPKADGTTPPTEAVDLPDAPETAPETPMEDLAAASEVSTSNSAETPQAVDSEAESRILPRSE